MYGKKPTMNLRGWYTLAVIVCVFLLIPIVSANTTVNIYSSGAGDGFWARDGVSDNLSTIRTSAANYISTTGTNGDGRTGLFSHASTSGNYIELDRAFYQFDTSSIPDAAIILNATIHLYGQSSVNQFAETPTIALYALTPATPGTTVLADFTQGGTTALTTAIASTSITTSGYNNFIVTNLSYINKTGWTPFAVKNNWDASNTPPSWSASKYTGTYFQTSEHSGTAQDPYIEITYAMSDGTLNADFTATPLTGSPPLLVNFLDISNYGANIGTTCNWSFGDFTSASPYSSVCGNVQHIYNYAGTYNINYTIVNSNGTVSLLRSNYITALSSQQAGYLLPTMPKPVAFKIVDAFQKEIPGATVVARYVSSSLPSTDVNWLVSAFGISESVASEMLDGSVAMSGTTATDGSVSFIMYAPIQYQITITNATMGLSKQVTIAPQDNEYVVTCVLTSQIAPVSRAVQLANSTIYVTEPNSSFFTFHMVYQDISNFTTNVKWNITCLGNSTVMYSKDFGDPDTNVKMDNFTITTLERGAEYRAMYTATREV